MQGTRPPVDEKLVETLAWHVNSVIRVLLVAGRQGAPAEGKIPFNPLYFNILRILGEGGPYRPSYIAERLCVPRTTMSTAVKALMRLGFIASSEDSQDKRATALSLTGEGNGVLAAILRQDLRNSKAMLEALDANEREAFVQALGKVALEINKE